MGGREGDHRMLVDKFQIGNSVIEIYDDCIDKSKVDEVLKRIGAVRKEETDGDKICEKEPVAV